MKSVCMLICNKSIYLLLISEKMPHSRTRVLLKKKKTANILEHTDHLVLSVLGHDIIDSEVSID